MKIKEAFWWSLDRTAVKVAIIQENGEEIETLATIDDTDEFGKEVWALLMKNKNSIQEPPLYQAIKGEIDWPIDMVQFPDGRVEFLTVVMKDIFAAIDARLHDQFTPRALVAAGRDPVAKKNRENEIAAIFAIEDSMKNYNTPNYSLDQSPELTAMAAEFMHDLNLNECTGKVKVIAPEGVQVSSVNEFTVPIPVYYFMHYGLDEMIANQLVAGL